MLKVNKEIYSLSRFAVGTAQFGLQYGIANQGGQVSKNEAFDILQLARSSGLNTIDTAIGYGSSEEVLGEIGVNDWQVITKVPPIPQGCDDVGVWMKTMVGGAMRRLNIPQLKGLLLHRPLELLGPSGKSMYQELCTFKEEGLVEKIGFSISSPKDLNLLWQEFQPDLVQVPFNVLDRRIKKSGWLKKLHEAGTEIHSRSTFLQGLLLMDVASRPESFNRWNGLWQKWSDWLKGHGLTPLEGALAFVRSQSEIDRIVVGVDSTFQFEGILMAAQSPIHIAPEFLAIEDENLIDPSLWKLS